MDLMRDSKLFRRLAHGGSVLNREEKLAMTAALYTISSNEHLRELLYWGTIFTHTGYYRIAYGYKRDVIRHRKFFYTSDCMNWQPLPHANATLRHLALLPSAMLTGDPTHIVDVRGTSACFEEEEHATQLLGTTLTEVNRLAGIVEAIHEEAAVVPRGAIIKMADGLVLPNDMFGGLDEFEAFRLKSYMHLRRPKRRWDDNLKDRCDYKYSHDFLDPLDKDPLPQPAWSMQFPENGQTVILRSLLFPGMLFFHDINTPDWGFSYHGNGRMNLDLPFMV